MICITGAGGTVGTEVLNQLKKTDSQFRVAYFSAGKADRARSDGIDAAVIDYNQPDTLETAFRAVYGQRSLPRGADALTMGHGEAEHCDTVDPVIGPVQTTVSHWASSIEDWLP